MQQIEADFGINLKDIQLKDVSMKLGDNEYVYNNETGLWKTKDMPSNNEEIQVETIKGNDRKKRKALKKKLEEEENMTLEDMKE